MRIIHLEAGAISLVLTLSVCLGGASCRAEDVCLKLIQGGRTVSELDPSLRMRDPNPAAITKVRVLAIVPNSSSSKMVLNKDRLTPTESGQLDRVALRLSALPDTEVCRDRGGIEILDRFGPQDEGELVILSGHSENTNAGQKFYFPDGQGYGFQELHERASKNNIHLVILTCNSPDFRLDRKISFEESYEIARALQAELSTPRSKDEIIDAARTVVSRDKMNTVLCFVAATGVGAGSSIIVEMLDNDDDEVEKQ